MADDSNAPQDEAAILARMDAINEELYAHPRPEHERMWALWAERGELTARVWHLRRERGELR